MRFVHCYKIVINKNNSIRPERQGLKVNPAEAPEVGPEVEL